LIKPISTWCVNRVQVIIHMDFIFQNIASSLFVIKLRFHKIYLRKGEQLFWAISFYWRKRCELSKEKENRIPWVCVIEIFQAWHHRTWFVPYNSLSKKHNNKVIFHLFWVPSPSLGRLGWCVSKVYWTCVSYFVTRVLPCNRLPV